MTDKLKNNIFSFLTRDSFGALIIAFLAINRSIYAFMKARNEDLIYTGIDDSNHWLEALLPMYWWVGIWLAIAVVAIVSIWVYKAKPYVIGTVVWCLLLWAASAITSPQVTSPVSGFLWLSVVLLLIWGSSRVSPEDFIYQTTPEDYIKNELKDKEG